MLPLYAAAVALQHYLPRSIAHAALHRKHRVTFAVNAPHDADGVLSLHLHRGALDADAAVSDAVRPLHNACSKATLAQRGVSDGGDLNRWGP